MLAKKLKTSKELTKWMLADDANAGQVGQKGQKAFSRDLG